MNQFGFSVQEIQIFLLIFVRVAAMMAILPIFGDQAVPVMVRLGLSFFIAVIIYPIVPKTVLVPQGVSEFIFQLSQTIFAGLFIGFFGIIFFGAIQLAGEIAGFQMGFAIVSVLDPMSRIQMSIIAQFQNFMAILIFLLLDGHHLLIRGMVESFQTVPLLGATLNGNLGQILIQMTGQMFVVAVKISAPIFVTLLLTNVGLGIVARTLPQMNVFIVGFPLQIGLGLATLAISVPLFFYVFEKYFVWFSTDWIKMIRLF